MIIKTLVEKETDVKDINLYMKVSDRFSATITNNEGDQILDLEDTYVPDWFPGQHYGEYLYLKIDIETGQIINWRKPTEEELKEYIEEYRDESD